MLQDELEGTKGNANNQYISNFGKLLDQAHFICPSIGFTTASPIKVIQGD